MDDVWLNAADFANRAECRVERFAVQQAAVDAAQADAATAQMRHQVFVDFARQHLLHHFHGFGIGYAQAADKFAFFADFGETGVDVGAAAVDEHDFHADLVEKQHVAQHRGFDGVVGHGVAAVFHHHAVLLVFLQIGDGFVEPVHIFLAHV